MTPIRISVLDARRPFGPWNRLYWQWNEQNVYTITHNSALLLLKIWHKGQYFLWISKSTSVRMILHQRHLNKASLDICISTSQGTWLSNNFTSRGVNFTSFPLGHAVNANPVHNRVAIVIDYENNDHGRNQPLLSQFSIYGWARSQPMREDVTYATSSLIG